VTAVVDDINLKPLIDQAKQPLVSNPMLKKAPQPVPIQRVIGLNNLIPLSTTHR
jgi:hypothetical protein